ncbi:MAG: hypothetical protein KC777_29815 [Cyanobacteria bacterium HKST-UBA02]|nr:hypothetical protein [Cyanobacteria bacterium HKST-UBA02]
MNPITILLFLLPFLLPTPVCAQWSKIFREGMEVVVKKSGKLGREGAQEALESSGKLVPQAGKLLRRSPRSLDTMGQTLTHSAGRQATAKLIGQSDEIAKSVIGRFGDSGAKAMKSLSKEGTEKLASMADELAKSGNAKTWLDWIARSGDKGMDFLWNHRGSVAVLTVSSVALMQPAEVVQAGEEVITKTIDVVGSQVAKPLIEESAKQIARPIAEQAGARFPWTMIWVAMFGGLGSFLLWLKYSKNSLIRVTSLKK